MTTSNRALFVFATALTMATASSVFAADVCVPPQSVLCSLSAECGPDNNGYYVLSTTFQRVASIMVQNDPNAQCEFKSKSAPAVLAKLKGEANQLKAAGACSIIIDNISP